MYQRTAVKACIACGQMSEVLRRHRKYLQGLCWHCAFDTFVQVTETCWIWTGYANPGGYGVFHPFGKPELVHRLAYKRYVGPIPDRIMVDHACRNRGCVNPEHLRLATPGENNENHSGPRRDNQSGYRGVYHQPRRRAGSQWMAYVQHRGKAYWSHHATPEEANEAAIAMRLRLHTFNDLDRQPA